MKISVIIATYKRVKFLNSCVLSLFKQKRVPDEIILVGSEDDKETQLFAEQMKKKSKAIHYFYIKNKNVMAAENLGVKNASGDILCFIDDDAIARNDWIENIEMLYDDPNVGAVGGPSIPCINNLPVYEKTILVGKVLFPGRIIDNLEKITDNIVEIDHLKGCNMSFRRELLIQNLFDESLKGSGFRFEMDACLNIRNKKFKILYSPNIIVYHFVASMRIHDRRKNPYKRIHDSNYNNTYVLMKNLSLPYKSIFIIYTMIWGDSVSPGLLKIVIYSLKNRKLKSILGIFPVFHGKIEGIFHALKNI